MKTTNSLAIVLLLAASLVCAQTLAKVDNDRELQKAVLLSEVKTLALEVPKLDPSLARAMAGAEIADAAWTLDRKWAKSLLKDAYQLTYLTEEEQRLIGVEAPGTPPRPPNALTRARTDVRKRILSIARRDSEFANQLLNDTSTRLTKDDRQMMYAQMTRMAISRGEFETARKLIDKLPDGERKSQLTEKMNVKEAMSLARKKDLLAAQGLAARLTTTHSIRQVYPVIIQGYATNKDQVAASAAINQAVKQLERIDDKSSEAILMTLGELAEAVLPVDTLLGAEIVDDIVTKANRTPIDTTQGRTGIDSNLFRSLASKDEVRARSAAQSFKDRLQRTAALAAVYQWKAKELETNKKGQ